ARTTCNTAANGYLSISSPRTLSLSLTADF
ncbi:hypothetical protein ACG3RN_22930, partial [Pseudomonas aeruginosa]